MKITNNTSYNVTLVNGKVVKGYDTIYVYEATEELQKQLKNLKESGTLRVEKN